MDVKEIAGLAATPAIHPLVSENATPPPAQEQKSSIAAESTFALRPVVKVDPDGLALLQFQDPQSGEVVLQIPSVEAARQYRERDVQEGTGTAPAEQVMASASGGAAAIAAAGVAAVAVQQPAQAPHTKNTVLPQAVKPVEAQSGSKESGSVRIKA